MPVVPSKPQSGRYSIAELTRIINAIIDYLRNSRLRPGNGIKISETATSVIISAETSDSSSGSAGGENVTAYENYSGPFAVTMTGNTLRVNSGFALCNGTFLPVSGKTIAAQTGYLCVETELLTDSGIWKQPVVNYGTPDKCHFPIAYITAGEDGSLSVHSCRCPVAVFIETDLCPVEEEWTREQMRNR